EKPHVELITKRLADAGYDCGLSGKLHIASAWNGREKRTDDGYREYHYSHAPTQGVTIQANDYVEWVREQGRFDEVFDMSRYNAETHGGCRYHRNIPAELHQTSWCADRAIDFIREHAEGGERLRQPWLYSVNIFDPHPAFDGPLEYESRYDAESLPSPLYRESDLLLQERLTGAFFQKQPVSPGPRQQRNKANYYGMIELIDENVGRMIEALEQTAQRENTVVIFTSDHGEMLGDHGLGAKGARFYEGAVRIPLIFSWPGRFKEGLKVDGLTELNDIAPTIAEFAGLPALKSHGNSLVPILAGDADPGRNHDYVRCEYYDALDMKAPNAFEEHSETWATMYREERWKLIIYHGLKYGELYDLENDPGEFENLWEDSSVSDTKTDLTARSFDSSVRAIDIGPQLIGRY
ncbi:MAG: sulfatase-like hydrolase/transferase, partial [Spirochaetales bacterium]|nr:sulfatase-like hydrolase/transferase [Spirochaetales bacterium]